MLGGIELNRTALTIRMLMILKARAIQEPISTEKLATLLETNPRNIREYRKELETAGFTIEHKKGPYGGYLLEKSALFPVPKLTRFETLALKEASAFIHQHKEFTHYEDFHRAMDKILGQVCEPDNRGITYIESPFTSFDQQVEQWIDQVREAIQLRLCIRIQYQGSKDPKPQKILVDPYDIVHYRKAYYLIGFSHSRKDYRIYRFSSQRLFDLQITSQSFLWDTSYQLHQVISRFGLIRSDVQKVIVWVDPAIQSRFEEFGSWGHEVTKIDEQKYSFLCFDRYELYRQIFSFDGLVKILEPQDFVKEFQGKINQWKEFGE